MLRQLSRPALLVATYKGDAAGMATAAIEEVEKPLALCLQELERLSLNLGGNHFRFHFHDTLSRSLISEACASIALNGMCNGVFEQSSQLAAAWQCACASNNAVHTAYW